jgi:hypothetical protein
MEKLDFGLTEFEPSPPKDLPMPCKMGALIRRSWYEEENTVEAPSL